MVVTRDHATGTMIRCTRRTECPTQVAFSVQVDSIFVSGEVASPMSLDHLDAAPSPTVRRPSADRCPRGVAPARRRTRNRPGAVDATRAVGRGARLGSRRSTPTRSAIPVTAFVTLEIRQGGGHDPVGEHLAAIPEVIEAHTVTGPGDLWVRVVARSNADLQRVLDAVVAHPGIERSATMISLSRQIDHRMLPFVESDSRPRRRAARRAPT